MIPEHVESKIERIPECGCWIWTGTIDKDGYGRIYVGRNGRRRLRMSAHRFFYELFFRGKVPIGRCILHHCDTPSCVNPYHLYLGTPRDNANDQIKRGRVLCGERNPRAKLTEQQVVSIRKDTRTQCKIAEEYGVNQSKISDIKLSKTWKNVL